MPGEKERDRFIAELLVGHARAVFVLRVMKHREKVTGIAAGSAAIADDAVENALDEGDFPLDAKIGGRGHPMWNKKGAPEVGAEFQQQLKRFSDVLRVARDIGVKQRFGYNLQGEPHHFPVDVALFPVAPALKHALRVSHHGFRISGDAPAMEPRLHEPPLPQPEIAFACEQSFAKNMPVRPQNAPLDVAARMAYQDFLDVLGVIDKNIAKIEHADAHDISVARQFTEHL